MATVSTQITPCSSIYIYPSLEFGHTSEKGVVDENPVFSIKKSGVSTQHRIN